MTVMFALLGFLAFLSGYLVSLEDRFQRDGLFRPFSLADNLKASPRARKTLTWFGVFLWGSGAVFYVFGPEGEPPSVHDGLSCLVGAVIVYGFMSNGYAREIEWKKTGRSANSTPPFNSMSRHELHTIAIKSGWALGKVCAVLLSISAFKWIVSTV